MPPEPPPPPPPVWPYNLPVWNGEVGAYAVITDEVAGYRYMIIRFDTLDKMAHVADASFNYARVVNGQVVYDIVRTIAFNNAFNEWARSLGFTDATAHHLDVTIDNVTYRFP